MVHFLGIFCENKSVIKFQSGGQEWLIFFEYFVNLMPSFHCPCCRRSIGPLYCPLVHSPLLGKSDVQDEDLPLDLGVELGEDGLQLGHGKERLVARDQREVVRDSHPVQKYPETALSGQFSRQALEDGESIQMSQSFLIDADIYRADGVDVAPEMERN